MPVIYVTGMHGSGTSLVSNYLQHCGVEMMGGSPTDFLGEHKQFRMLSHKILRESKIHRYGESFNHAKIRPSPETLTKMNKQIKDTLYALNDKKKWWGWKAPINSLCIWAWLPILSKYVDDIVVLHVYRNPVEVIGSFHRRKSNKDIRYISKGHPHRHLEGVWADYTRSVITFQKAHPKECRYFYVQGKDIIDCPQVLIRSLGIDFKPIKSIVKPGRYIQSNKIKFHTEEAKHIWGALEKRKLRCS